jgi:predicted nucleotidyltransferase
MNRDQIIARLKEREADLRERGVAHAALFGSVARGDDRPDSDIDILVELDPAARVTVFDYVGIKEYIEGLFPGPVDVVNREGLRPHVRPPATADAIYAFRDGKSREKAPFGDIRYFIDLIGSFLKGYGYQRFADDLRTFHAVIRCLEITSEASRRISPETKARHPVRMSVLCTEMCSFAASVPTAPRHDRRGDES